jgi:F0F1-type ATP synthase membrane subunit b/b'
MFALDFVLAAGGSIIDLDATFFILVGLFFVAMLVLSTLLFNPVFKVLDARRSATEGAMEESRMLAREAEEKRREYEKLLQEIKSKAAADREAMRIESRRSEAEALERGKKDANAIIEDARVSLRSEIDQTRKNLEDDVRMLGEALAAKVLGALAMQVPPAAPSAAPAAAPSGGIGRLSSLGSLGRPGNTPGGKP